MTVDYNVKSRAKIVISILLLLSIIPILMIVGYIITGNWFQCNIYKLTGMYCSGCGGTRMMIAFIKGDIYQAFRYNPYLFITLPMISILSTIWIFKYIMYNKISKHMDKMLITYAFSLLVYGVIRNIHMFSWLAPTLI